MALPVISMVRDQLQCFQMFLGFASTTKVTFLLLMTITNLSEKLQLTDLFRRWRVVTRILDFLMDPWIKPNLITPVELQLMGRETFTFPIIRTTVTVKFKCNKKSPCNLIEQLYIKSPWDN